MSLLAVRAQLITPLLEIFGAKSNNTRRHKKNFLKIPYSVWSSNFDFWWVLLNIIDFIVIYRGVLSSALLISILQVQSPNQVIFKDLNKKNLKI